MHVWHVLLDLYLGRRGYRASLIAYGIGFWLFALGVGIWLSLPAAQSLILLVLRTALISIGLVVLVLMTYPVIYCAFKITDTTRPYSRLRRILEPAGVGALSPLYLMLLVSNFIKAYAGQFLLGLN